MKKPLLSCLAAVGGLSVALLLAPGSARADVEGGAEAEPTVAHITVTVAPTGAEHVVTTAPPAPKVEKKPTAPGADHIWVSGHWKWDPGAKTHVWVPGHWEKHKVHHTWVHAHWVFYGGKYHFIPGYWRSWHVVGGAEPLHTKPHIVVTTAPVGAEHVITVAPPAPKEEKLGPPPAGDHVWVGGHWKWDPGPKTHVWVPGHWEKHKVGHVWVHSHWVFFGGKYHFIPGYWKKT